MTPDLVGRFMKAVFEGEEFVSPKKLYLALFTTRAFGLEPSEVNVDSYSRQPVEFVVSKDARATNSNGISFSIAKKNWGNITHFGIYDSENGGELLVFSPLEASKSIEAGDTVKIYPGSIAVKMT